MKKTFIPGKDAALEDSILRMHRLLQEHRFELEEVSWLNPAPHVWSVHVREKACPLLFTNGKGTTRNAALASALGEFFERLSTNFFFAGYFLSDYANGDFVHYPQERWFHFSGENIPEGLLDDKLCSFYNPEGDLLPKNLLDTNSYCPKRGICALPFTRLRDGKEIYFPVNILSNLYVSNGMAAGNSEPEARVQALSEILERHVKNYVIANGISLPELPQNMLRRFPRVKRSLDELKNRGYPTLVHDASLGGRYPVVNVTLLSPDQGSCFASFGAHPNFQVALERTVTELLQGRPLDALDFSPPSFDIETVADQQNLEAHFIDSNGLLSWEFFRSSPDYSFCEWNFQGDTSAEFEYLRALVEDMGHDVYLANYRHLGMYVCRIVVPGMSEIYPVSDLVWGNDNQGAEFREQLLAPANLSQESLRELYRNLEDIADAQPVGSLAGIAFDPGSAWANLRVAELKCLLALALGESEHARIWSEWCVHFGHPDAAHCRLYRYIHSRLSLADDPKNYAAALALLHGKDTARLGEQLLARKQNFYDLPAVDLEKIKAHSQLLKAYEKLQRAKKNIKMKS